MSISCWWAQFPKLTVFPVRTITFQWTYVCWHQAERSSGQSDTPCWGCPPCLHAGWRWSTPHFLETGKCCLQHCTIEPQHHHDRGGHGQAETEWNRAAYKGRELVLAAPQCRMRTLWWARSIQRIVCFTTSGETITFKSCLRILYNYRCTFMILLHKHNFKIQCKWRKNKMNIMELC